MTLKVIRSSNARNYTLKICGPINFRTTHHNDHAVVLREYKLRHRYTSIWGANYYKILANKKYLRDISLPDVVGTIQWEVDCPVCLKAIEPRSAYSREKYGYVYGTSYNMEHNDKVRVVKLPNHEGLVVCSQQCHDLFLLSPQIYEENYL